MPELPEAETIAVELNRRLGGLTLGRVFLSRTDIVHGDPRPLEELLTGRRVNRVYRRAKRVILQLEPEDSNPEGANPEGANPEGAELVFRLGMSGRLMLVASDRLVEPHTHLRIEVPALSHELRFRDPRRFGGIWCFAGSKTHMGKRLGELGVEPLETDAATFRKILHRKRQIKALLMDQRIIAGLGNIYCDEALHAAGIHPLTPANTLEAARAGRLLRAIKSTLRRAIRHKGSTLVDYRQADGEAGSFQKYHRVYGREGKTCQRCGTMITRIRAAGRSTYLCPQCQPAKRRKVKKSKSQNKR